MLQAEDPKYPNVHTSCPPHAEYTPGREAKCSKPKIQSIPRCIRAVLRTPVHSRPGGERHFRYPQHASAVQSCSDGPGDKGHKATAPPVDGRGRRRRARARQKSGEPNAANTIGHSICWRLHAGHRPAGGAGGSHFAEVFIRFSLGFLSVLPWSFFACSIFFFWLRKAFVWFWFVFWLCFGFGVVLVLFW